MITSDAVDDEAASRAAVLVNLADDFPLLAALCYVNLESSPKAHKIIIVSLTNERSCGSLAMSFLYTSKYNVPSVYNSN